ncbi:limonene-1,2-epoxide hydrolase family protein [Novosphingobium sp. MMS21-SN21R]|uniref:limonene-1,2-epoxide hydrolase family protein n=1 Tax=Novosphingobium sp. MMS21-SN21R TaxID=2969298 RepID=UPI002885036F|nr:limonene-1,2-epoxide hydrolase family protein [Novosphingobium sp. MMS21-SN21R]MDT0509617.1 limonene-1,2-epoxide hydrolase family protein [Novosphingobium sp. MMS21-SN21R]
MSNSKETAVRKFLALFHTTTLDLDKIRDALAPDARWQAVVPLAEVVYGAEGICREAERQYRIYKDCDCELLNIASSGDTVFTERVDRVRLLEGGKEVITHVAGIFTVNDDDKIVFWREYWDMLDIADQIGISGEDMRTLMDTQVAA